MRTTIARHSATAAGLLATAVLVSGCGGADNASPTAQGSAAGASSSATSGPTISVTIAGDKVTPQGRRLKVKVGQTVSLEVTSDRAGELHVHSTPEQHLDYTQGTTKLMVSIDKPGIVDIEDHVADVVIAQLEVS